MSWNHIKTVLIFLFLIINIYLIYSSGGITSSKSVTEFDEETIAETVEITKNNFGIYVDKNIVPLKLDNLNNIDATNIIYTEKFDKSGYDIKHENGTFYADIETKIYSFNESNASDEVIRFLKNLGIDENLCELNFSKSDEGLVCVINEKFSQYRVFNGRITIIFKASEMHVRGRWYIPETSETKSKNSSLKMISISGVIIDAAQKMQLENTGKKITDIKYGYYVSYYDENKASKSASAIPCYMIKTDSDYEYYYDAINGKSLKQED